MANKPKVLDTIMKGSKIIFAWRRWWVQAGCHRPISEQQLLHRCWGHYRRQLRINWIYLMYWGQRHYSACGFQWRNIWRVCWVETTFLLQCLKLCWCFDLLFLLSICDCVLCRHFLHESQTSCWQRLLKSWWLLLKWIISKLENMLTSPPSSISYNWQNFIYSDSK